MGNTSIHDNFVITGSGLHLRTRDWGGDGLSVLMVHGLDGTADMWELLMMQPGLWMHGTAFDLRGHGQSEKPDSAYDLAEMGSDLMDVMAGLNIERPIIIAHSFGALIALWAAAHHPDIFRALVLIDGGIIDETGQSWDEIAAQANDDPLNGTPAVGFRARLTEMGGVKVITPAVEAALWTSFEVDTSERVQRRLPHAYKMRIVRTMWENAPGMFYGRITCPVLMMPTREEGMDFENLRLKEQGIMHVQSRLPDTRIVWLDDTIHDAHLHRPDRIADEIGRFAQDYDIARTSAKSRSE
jgi:pimeloyl-ACP methyl ester carboxylesterase